MYGLGVQESKFSPWFKLAENLLVVSSSLCMHSTEALTCTEMILGTHTLQPLYNTAGYNTVLDIRRFKVGSQSRPRWLSWMRRSTGDQEVAGSNPAEVGNILSWRLIMKYFLRSFSPFR